MLTRFRFATLALALLATLGAAQGEAALITYTASGVASGSLGATQFVNQTVTFNMTGDTNAVVMTDATTYRIAPTLTTVTIGSLGMANVLSSISIRKSLGLFEVFSDEGTPQAGGVIGAISNSFNNWDLRTAFGPIVGDGGIFGRTIPKSAGALVFNQNFIGPVTVAAVLGSSAVPEASSVVLAGLGLAISLGAWKTRRGRDRNASA